MSAARSTLFYKLRALGKAEAEKKNRMVRFALDLNIIYIVPRKEEPSQSERDARDASYRNARKVVNEVQYKLGKSSEYPNTVRLSEEARAFYTGYEP